MHLFPLVMPRELAIELMGGLVCGGLGTIGHGIYRLATELGLKSRDLKKMIPACPPVGADSGAML